MVLAGEPETISIELEEKPKSSELEVLEVCV
jgi:hypothetical protein